MYRKRLACDGKSCYINKTKLKTLWLASIYEENEKIQLTKVKGAFSAKSC